MQIPARAIYCFEYGIVKLDRHHVMHYHIYSCYNASIIISSILLIRFLLIIADVTMCGHHLATLYTRGLLLMQCSLIVISCILRSAALNTYIL